MTRGTKVALGVGVAVVAGIALYVATRSTATAIGAGLSASATAAADSAGRRVVIGTESSGAPIFGTGTAVDKSPASVAERERLAAADVSGAMAASGSAKAGA